MRSIDDYVALTLSLERGGDVEVAFTPSEYTEIISRLQHAVYDAGGAALAA